MIFIQHQHQQQAAHLDVGHAQEGDAGVGGDGDDEEVEEVVTVGGHPLTVVSCSRQIQHNVASYSSHCPVC